MSNETLRVKVGLIGDAVLMQVLEMPERFRGDFSFEASNGLEVESAHHAALNVGNADVIYLRGDDKDCDDYISGESCFGDEEARDLYGRVVVALREAKAEMESMVLEEDEPADTPGFPCAESCVI